MTYAFKDKPKINFSELDDKFWINDGDDILWFESVREAQDMARQLEISRAVARDRAATLKWLRESDLFGDFRNVADELERDYERRDDADKD